MKILLVFILGFLLVFNFNWKVCVSLPNLGFWGFWRLGNNETYETCVLLRFWRQSLQPLKASFLMEEPSAFVNFSTFIMKNFSFLIIF